MKKLIEALHVIQEECRKHNNGSGVRQCRECPLNNCVCKIHNEFPDTWKINDEVQKALL